MDCRCCGEDRSIEYLDLGMQPLANSYHKNDGEILPRYPLKVMLCANCYLSYLSETVNPNELFKTYLYISGTTQTLKNHWRELAKDAVSRGGPNPSVMDIACNDASNLEQFRDFTHGKLLGVDPAENLRELSKARDIDVIVDYWGEGVVPNESQDIITAANVFAHISNVEDFLKAAKLALKDDGILILEFPYCREMLEKVCFDQIYHEHLQYYLVNPLSYLFDRAELKVIDIILTPIHGGSIRFILGKNLKDHCAKLYEMIEEEKAANLLNTEIYLEYGAKVESNKKSLLKLIKRLKKVIGFGASAKSATILNSFQISLDYIVDENPLKHGLFSPGMNIPIKDPKCLADEPDDINIILTAWNFATEIKEKVRKIRGHDRDLFIYYVPNVNVE